LGQVAGSRNSVADGLFMFANGCVAAAIALGLGQACFRFCRSYGVDAGLGGKDIVAPLSAEPAECPLHQDGADLGEPADVDAALSVASSDDAAWPFFRGKFLRGSCMLWLSVSATRFAILVLGLMTYESLRVFLWGWLTCITTGLGAVPFLFVKTERISDDALAISNTVACGTMLAASMGMLQEAHDHCGVGDWQLFVGLGIGAVFIKVSSWAVGDEDEQGVDALCGAIMERRHFRKAVLIFTVMFCHSAAEGVAVGVSFDGHLRAEFGVFVSILLAIHNVPEGLTVALVLVPRGISTPLAMLIATLTSVPQPFMAFVAFLFVDAFQWLLPFGLSFAAGAMVYVSLHELLVDAVRQLGRTRAFVVGAVSFVAMLAVQRVLHALTGM